MTRTRLMRVGLAAVLAGTALVATGGGASAANCGKAKERYHVTRYDTFREFDGEEFVDGPGGKISVTKKWTSTFTTSVNGSVSAQAKKVWGAISGQLGFEATWSKTEEKGQTFEKQIPEGRYGHVRFWTEKWNTRWLRYIDFERCPDEWVEEGDAVVVSKKGGFLFWDSADTHGAPPGYKSRHYDGGYPSGGTET